MNHFLARRRSFLLATLFAAAAGFSCRMLAAQEAVEIDVAEVDATDGAIVTAPVGEIKTVAVVGLSSYNNLVSDVNFVGSLADRPELGQMLQGTIALFTQGKGLDGVDQSKPWGVIVQTDGQQFYPVGCIAVTNLDNVLGIARNFGAQVQDGDEGAKQIVLPNGKTIHVKESSGWAYIAQMEAALSNLPADPLAELAKIVTEYDLGARISVQNVPEMYRKMAVQAMKAGMQDGLKQKEGEDDKDYEMRRQMAEAQIEQVERMVNEIDEVVAGWAVDASQQKTYLDFTYRFLPDSKMARQIAGYGQPKTNFAGFFQPDAAATLTFASQADPALIKEDLDKMRTMMQTMRKQAENAIDEEEDIPDDATREAVKAALGDFMDAFQATMESGQMDGGAALQLGADKLTLVAGALVKEPGKFEEGLKKLATLAEKEPNFNGVQWNAANHQGVSFHTLSLPIPEDQDEVRQIFGDKADVAIGIGSDAVYVAVGRDSLEAVKKAIDASAAEPNKEVPPFELSMSLGQILEMAAATHADEDERPMIQAIADMLKNDAQGRDHVRTSGTFIDNGLQYRLEAEEGVLRAIGKATMVAQQKAQQEAMQGQGP